MSDSMTIRATKAADGKWTLEFGFSNRLNIVADCSIEHLASALRGVKSGDEDFIVNVHGGKQAADAKSAKADASKD